ncbi:MAG TPA: TolC family protein [Gemmatimonadaceae bacterium]|jgi:outer membrane protein
MRSLRLIALLAIPAQLAFAQQSVPAASSASTATGTPLSLDEAISTAQRNNPNFQQFKNTVRSADAQVKAANGQLLPQVQASFRTGYQQGGNQIIQGVQLGSTDAYNSSYFLGLSYNILPSAAFVPRAARAQRDAAEADVTSQSESLRSGVTSAYITAVQQEALAAVSDTLVASAQGQLDLVNAKMELGAGTIVDVRAAEVTLGQAQVQALTSHNAAQVAKLQLYQLMGVPADLSRPLNTQFTITPPNMSVDSLVSLARRVNPDLAAKKSRETASELNVKVAKSSYLPSLSLSTGYGAQAFGYANSDALVQTAQANNTRSYKSCLASDSLRVGAGLSSLPCDPGILTADEMSAIRSGNKPFNFIKSPYSLSAGLNLPIFNGFARETNIEQSKVTRDNALYDVKARDLQITTDVTQAYLTMLADYKTIDLQTTLSAQAAANLDAQTERYKVGAATFLDVTTARATYEQQQIARVNAIYEYHRAFAALENAVGRPLR